MCPQAHGDTCPGQALATMCTLSSSGGLGDRTVFQREVAGSVGWPWKAGTLGTELGSGRRHRGQQIRSLRASGQLVHTRPPAFSQRRVVQPGMVTRTLQLLLKGRPSAKLGKPRAPVAARGRGPGGWEAEMALPRAAEPTAGPWSPDGGGEEQLMSSRRSAVRGPKTHKPFIGVSGGETRMQPFIYFGFHFSLLFLTCRSRSVTGFLKKQDFLSQWRGTLCFPQS